MPKYLPVALLSIMAACADTQSAEHRRPAHAQRTMRTVEYRRHEFHHPPSDHRASLPAFVYDVPYLPACGVLPPLHILNEIFAGGGGDGGMSPGASWQPFRITADEYRELVAAIRETPVDSLHAQARYADVPLSIDPELDGIRDRVEWMAAACRKHRDAWHARVEAAGG